MYERQKMTHCCQAALQTHYSSTSLLNFVDCGLRALSSLCQILQSFKMTKAVSMFPICVLSQAYYFLVVALDYTSRYETRKKTLYFF